MLRELWLFWFGNGGGVRGEELSEAEEEEEEGEEGTPSGRIVLACSAGAKAPPS